MKTREQNQGSSRNGFIIALLCFVALAFLFFHVPIYAPVLPFVITVGVVVTARAFQNRDEAREHTIYLADSARMNCPRIAMS
jgi:hypothetical protein